MACSWAWVAPAVMPCEAQMAAPFLPATSGGLDFANTIGLKVLNGNRNGQPDKRNRRRTQRIIECQQKKVLINKKSTIKKGTDQLGNMLGGVASSVGFIDENDAGSAGNPKNRLVDEPSP